MNDKSKHKSTYSPHHHYMSPVMKHHQLTMNKIDFVIQINSKILKLICKNFLKPIQILNQNLIQQIPNLSFISY
jgi:hypothetical protein